MELTGGATALYADESPGGTRRSSLTSNASSSLSRASEWTMLEDPIDGSPMLTWTHPIHPNHPPVSTIVEQEEVMQTV